MKREMKCKSIYLLRHGQTVGDAALNGRTDVAVSELTQKNIAKAIIESQIQFDHIISSPLQRCAKLAENIAPSLGCQVELMPQIQEMSFGDVDGVAFSQLSSKWGVLESFWKDPANHQLPNAETLNDFHHRIIQGWKQILQRNDDHLLVVTHGGVIRMLLAHLLELDWQNAKLYSTLAIANASITHIQVSYLAMDGSNKANTNSAASETTDFEEYSLENDNQAKDNQIKEGQYWVRVNSIGSNAWPTTDKG